MSPGANDAANLQIVYSNLINILMQMTTNPKPSYSLDGESYSWNEYNSMILDKLEKVRQQMIFAGGPFEVRSLAR
jgi:hypothetical protein